MRANSLSMIFLLILAYFNVDSQITMQIKFCGKTSSVVPPTDGNGADQRHKGGIRLDLIRIGRLGQSRTAPFFSLGAGTGTAFKNGIWVDGCTNNTNQTYCSGCTKCSQIFNTSNTSVGVSEGKMVENVRMRSNSNDLYIESTGGQNVVCFVTDPFDITAQSGKTIETNLIYEGTSVDGFSTANINFSYRYNNGPWEQQLNQNSNFLRVIDTAILVIAKVPLATENLDGVVDFLMTPNPCKDKLTIPIESKKTFDASIFIRDINGELVMKQDYAIKEGKSILNIKTSELPSAIYLFQIADQNGRISSRKFIKE